MGIAFRCDQCGQRYQALDHMASRLFLCKRCRRKQTIPRRTASKSVADAVLLLDDKHSDPDETFDLSPVSSRSVPGFAAVPAQRWQANGTQRGSGLDSPALPKRASVRTSSPTLSRMGGWAKIAGGVWVTLILLGVIARILRPFLGPSPQGALLPGISQDNLGFIDNTQQSQAPARRNLGPPTFSEPNGWRNLVGGVRLTTIRIGGGPGPGRSGKLLVYLPAGVEFPGGPQAAQEGTYPCILITSAGTGLFHGISWDPEEEQVGSPEHLPWAKAGYVVVAFEEDGPLASDSPSNQEMQRAILAFHNAKAGIINGQTALNFVEQKLPCVDKRRVFAVGHSSTGTLALILAANDERVQGVAAFAPAINLETRFPADLIQALRQAGVSDLATDYSPHTNEGKLRNKPVFLFHALDDSNVKVAESQAAEARMKAIGVPVTLMVVPNGNHYDSMIREGIPSAISFFSKMR